MATPTKYMYAQQPIPPAPDLPGRLAAMRGGLQLDQPWVYSLSGSLNEAALARLVGGYARAGLLAPELLAAALEVAAGRLDAGAAAASAALGQGAAAVMARNPEAPLGFKPAVGR
jgi:hypothetical protein